MSNITRIEIPTPQIIAPTTVLGREVDTKRGFDVIKYSRDRIGEVVETVIEHFDDYVAATKFCEALPHSATVRYYLVPDADSGKADAVK